MLPPLAFVFRNCEYRPLIRELSTHKTLASPAVTSVVGICPSVGS
jgi:hypothetical protein